MKGKFRSDWTREQIEESCKKVDLNWLYPKYADRVFEILKDEQFYGAVLCVEPPSDLAGDLKPRHTALVFLVAFDDLRSSRTLVYLPVEVVEEVIDDEGEISI